MKDISYLFFHLTPTTLAAIVADLDEVAKMRRQRGLAFDAGCQNCGDDFYNMLRDARAERDGNAQRAEDLNGSNGEVAAILARQS